MTVAVPLGAANGASPRTGGTLRLYAAGDVGPLDPAVASEPPAVALMRLLSRQLVTYEPRADLRDWQAIAPVPDAALQVPSTYNAGLGASHRSYIVHLRPGVMWDTDPPRPVTTHDFVCGFKRLGNPVARTAALTYFTSTIRGMADFCAGYAAAVPATATAEELSAYQREHEIPGVFALDDETLVIDLLRPAPEFVNVLALTCASAAPAEYDAFVPGSAELRANLRSNGPYRIAAGGPGLRLERNPAWQRDSDPVRSANVDAVEVTREAGAADLPWASPLRAPRSRPSGSTVPGSTVPGSTVPGSTVPEADVSWSLDPYLVFNVADGAVAVCDVGVRRALSVALDRGALAERCAHLGGGAVRPAGRIVPPGNDPQAGDEPTDAGADRDRARSLLADAGYADGLTLTAVCRDDPAELDVARAYAADLDQAGVRVRVVALDDETYRHSVLRPPGGSPRGWDLTARSWSADWLYRNGRSLLQPLFETGASANYGGYSNPAVDELIARALDAAVEPQARLDAAWGAVERRVLDDAAVVPLLFRAPALPPRRGPHVRGAAVLPGLGYVDDLSALWLD